MFRVAGGGVSKFPKSLECTSCSCKDVTTNGFAGALMGGWGVNSRVARGKSTLNTN